VKYDAATALGRIEVCDESEMETLKLNQLGFKKS
jgi:hypothetical protein